MSGIHVPQMQKKDDALTTVMKGLQIARDVYGIKADMTKVEEHAAQQEEAKKAGVDEARGLRTPAQLAKLQESHDLSESPIAGSVKLYRRDEKGAESPIYASIRKAQEKGPDPLAQARLDLERQKFETSKSLNKERLAFEKSKDQKIVEKKNAPLTFEQRLKGLNGEERKRLDSASMGMASVESMATALKKGDSTFSLIGDNNFTVARRDFEEALGRMQSGGAITDDEASRFRKMAPGPLDSADMQATKLEKLGTEMALRIKNLGFEPDEIVAQRASYAKKADSRPAGVGEANAAPSAKPDPADVEAVNWLKNNPDDPSADGVRQKLRLKGLL